MVAALIDRLTFRSHVLDMNGDSYRLKATMQKRPDKVAQIFVSAVAHFFMSVGGSKFHERLAHFFIDIYIYNGYYQKWI